MAKVTALHMDTITEKSGHQMTGMAVGVCLTPAAPSPLPIPYPTMGSVAEGIIDPCMRTKIEGAKILTVGGCMKACHGNELELPGPLVVTLERSYSTAAVRHRCGVGWGWSHDLAWSARRRGDELDLTAPGGRTQDRGPARRGAAGVGADRRGARSETSPCVSSIPILTAIPPGTRTSSARWRRRPAARWSMATIASSPSSTGRR